MNNPLKKSLTIILKQYQKHQRLTFIDFVDFAVEVDKNKIILKLKNKQIVCGYLSSYVLLAGQYWSKASLGDVYQDWPSFVYSLDSKPRGALPLEDAEYLLRWVPSHDCSCNDVLQKAVTDAAQIMFELGEKNEAKMSLRRAKKTYFFNNPFSEADYLYFETVKCSEKEAFEHAVEGTSLSSSDPWLRDSYAAKLKYKRGAKSGISILKYYARFTRDKDPLNRLAAIQAWLHSLIFDIPKNMQSCHRLFQSDFSHLLNDKEPYIRECALAVCERIMFRIDEGKESLFYLDVLIENSIAQPHARIKRWKSRSMLGDTVGAQEDLEWLLKFQDSDTMDAFFSIFDRAYFINKYKDFFLEMKTQFKRSVMIS